MMMTCSVHVRPDASVRISRVAHGDQRYDREEATRCNINVNSFKFEVCLPGEGACIDRV